MVEDLPAIGYRVDAQRFVSGTWVVVGSAQVDVPAGGVGTFMIIVGDE